MSPEKKAEDSIVLEERVYVAANGFAVKTRKKAVSKTSGPTSRGRRIKKANVEGSGRYIKARAPGKAPGPLALDATLRAAMPKQASRRGVAPPGGGMITILPEDVRIKVLSRQTGASVLFTVDASGSMGSEEVTGSAKGIVLALLTDAYQKRDRVGLVAFRGTEARVLLPFTTSIELAQKRLATMPTGGKSPLALALAKSLEVIEKEKKRNPGRTPMMVLLTDGRANISMAGKEPFTEALMQAERIKALGLKVMVVDTDLTWIDSFPYARELAKALGAKCLRLADLKVERIVDFITG